MRMTYRRQEIPEIPRGSSAYDTYETMAVRSLQVDGA